MAEPRKSKARLTLSDLASVEVPSASVNDVLGSMAAAPTAPPEEVGAAPEADADAAGEAESTPTELAAPSAPSGPVSTRQLQALPKGVSPEVAAMLGLPEASSLEEPEEAPEAEAAAPEPIIAEPEPTSSSRGGLIGAMVVVLVGGAIAAWYATRPPALDTALYIPLAVEAPSAETPPVVEVAFLPVPEPIVPEPPTEASARERRPRPVRTDVREEDLF